MFLVETPLLVLVQQYMMMVVQDLLVVTGTSFHGDISQATGAAVGLGTALSQTQTSPLNKIYYTDRVLSICNSNN